MRGGGASEDAAPLKEKEREEAREHVREEGAKEKERRELSWALMREQRRKRVERLKRELSWFEWRTGQRPSRLQLAQRLDGEWGVWEYDEAITAARVFWRKDAQSLLDFRLMEAYRRNRSSFIREDNTCFRWDPPENDDLSEVVKSESVGELELVMAETAEARADAQYRRWLLVEKEWRGSGGMRAEVSGKEDGRAASVTGRVEAPLAPRASGCALSGCRSCDLNRRRERAAVGAEGAGGDSVEGAVLALIMQRRMEL
jgi:hypothetical protein